MCHPVKNCPGVSAKTSLASIEMDVIGLEFKIASICDNNVVKSSKNSFVLPMLLYNDYTKIWQRPPIALQSLMFSGG